MPIDFPPLRAEYEPTRATLHGYARAVGAIARTHGIAHPKWWHVALKLRPDALATDPIPLPGGRVLELRMDLSSHDIVVAASGGFEARVDMQSGATATEMGERLTAVVAEHGLEEPPDRDRFASDDPLEYDRTAAAAYRDAIVAVHTLFEQRRAGMGLRVSPIQLWPHGFDLAFDWFGTKTSQHRGEDTDAQLNLGFYPGGDPYFYSNPWPFDERLLEDPLPHGAVWHTEGWTGSRLPYAAVQGDPEGAIKLAEYASAVYEAALPSLQAG